MSEQGLPVATNTLSKKDNNAVDVYHTSCQCYFRPETGEIIFISESDSGEFDNLTYKLSRLMDVLDKARNEYSIALQEYYNKKKDIADREQLSGYFDAVVTSEMAVEKTTDAVRQEVGEFDERKGYTSIVELIPLEPLRKCIYGRFYCYIKQTDYESFNDRLTIFNFKDFGQGDFYERDENGRIVAIKTDEIIRRFKKIKESLTQMTSDNRQFNIKVDYEKNLTDWANVWNDQSKYTREGQVIDVSAGAQFLRFSANAGSAVDWAPRNQQGRISGEASCELTLAAAQATTTFYRPDRAGWQLRFIINDQNKEANLGVLRAKIETVLTGFAGASANIEGNLQFVISDGKQRLMGARTPLSRFEERQNGVLVETEKESAVTSEVAGELFAGVKLGGACSGALQWLKPFDSLVEYLPDMAGTFIYDTVFGGNSVSDKESDSRKQVVGKNTGEGQFTDFAAFSSGVEIQAGAGLSGEFEFWFEKGRFKFRIAAGVCLGPGAKGSAGGEVSPAQFIEFAVWAVYQLYGMDYRHFKVFEKNSFLALTYILIMGGLPVYERYYKEMEDDARKVFEDFRKFVKGISDDITDAVEASNKRNQFAESINRSPSDVYTFTPEGKGIALYLLVQDGYYDRIDINNHRLVSVIDNSENGLFPLPDTGHERKKAVLTILSSIQTRREWGEVLVRMTPSGEKITSAMPEHQLVEHQEQVIRNFLQIGLDQDKKLDELISRLNLRDFRETYRRLKDKPAFGYPFAPNCTKQYALFCDDNPWYTSLCHILPQDPTIRHRLEPMNK
ncbi:hypothetical protein [Escherichia coli]|uniref:hypothetical protein n=1 Tax=Escherichia coli TaxID=562 RepID=UPI00235EDB94|nr:hypothetical protein [Escherichia coli]